MKVQGKRLAIHFVVKDEYRNENDVSEDMQLAYMNTVDWCLQPKWIRQSELTTIPYEKGNIFIFEEFNDDFISEFGRANPNARIVGPRCLLSCYMEGSPIPNTIYPVYNMAMNNLVVCTSRIPNHRREEIEKLVGYMGGDFTEPLTSRTTHLVVFSAFSKRHFIACEKGMHIMKSNWVERVWELNSKDNVKATDYNIMKEFACPIFYNLNITSSSLTLEEKAILADKINNNGGTYVSELINKKTNILILPSADGRKFKHAVRWEIPCIKPTWIDICIQKGHTVPYDNYIVKSADEITSTPIQKTVLRKPPPLIDSNETEISIIPSNSEKNTINDSEPRVDVLTMERSLKANEASIFKTPSKICLKNTEKVKVSQCEISLEGNLSYRKILQNIEISEIKKCGPIFDGCKLFLAGFNSNEEEKLRKVLNYGGALRFTELNESVTHIVVGNPIGVDLQQIENIVNKPHVVTLDWLSNSIQQKGLAKESTCAFVRENEKSLEPDTIVPQQPSPLSKKGFHILNPAQSIEKPEPPRVPAIDRNLIEKYSQSSQECDGYRPAPAAPAPPRSQVSNEQLSSTLFTGLSFAVIGHEKDFTDELKQHIIEYGGTVVTHFRGVVDYAIVPILHSQTKVTSNEIVTILWLEDCIFNMQIVEVKYYHLPIIGKPLQTSPLTGCVITFSAYNPQEKKYIENLAILLGAKCQDVLAKKANPDSDIHRTTHLICAQQQGSKYEAAIKWNLPIVTELWIKDCFKRRIKLPIDGYLTTSAKSSSQSSSSSQGSGPPPAVKPSCLQLSNSDEEMPNFRAAATSTKIGDITKETKGAHRSLFKSNRTEQMTPVIANVVSSVSRLESTSLEKKNKENESSKVSKLSNGPTSLLLEMNASNDPLTSGVKRKSRSESSDRKHRSPKKKAICLDKRSLSPVEEIGWQDTLTDLTHAAGSSSHSQNPKNSSQRNSQNAESVPSQKAQQIAQKRIPSPEPPVIRNIMISVDGDRKQQFEDLVERLGGSVTSTYESDCEESQRATHLVIDELKKTEKVLCSIASGLWVLHSSYLEQCQKEGKFLPEEYFEWGNPKNDSLLTNISVEAKSLALAAHRWRLIIQNGGSIKRPYVGMKVVIISTRNDGIVHSLTRVVKSGGGQILPLKDILKSTHCLMRNANATELIPVSLEVLAKLKIHCVPVVYLRDYLIEYPPPDPKLKYISEYQKFFK